MEKLSGKHYVLGVQHLFAMFGATVLVPYLTGLSPAIALLGAGIGTLLFHFITGGKVPVFLGSSFAFIGAIILVMNGGGDKALIQNRPYVQGGIIVAGLLYVVLSLLIYIFGTERVKSFFPPIVTGPVIMVIGLNLSPTAIDMAKNKDVVTKLMLTDPELASRLTIASWTVAAIVIITIILISVFDKGFFKLVPILVGIAVGFIAAYIFDLSGYLGDFKLIDISKITGADWFINFSDFTLPKFSLNAILLIAPIAFVTFMEHIGDITTNGAVVGKDFFKDPGIHKTVLGDGLATMFAGLIGAPANTTYGENTGVLAVTKMYDPRVLRIAAIYAILLGLIGKLGGVLQSIPVPVMGGVSMILFGMIASIGFRTLAESKLDFSHSRNLLIIALILVIGLGLKEVAIFETFKLSGLFMAMIIGVVANKILPEDI